MPIRSSGNSTLFLSFLYPSLCPRNASRIPAWLSSARQLRRHMTETGAEAEWTRLNPAPDDYSVTYFADKAKLTIYAGVGGNGCISFLRDAGLSDGPANGGDGGHGGNVYIQAVHGETSLHKLVRRRIIRAEKGKHGQGSSKDGKRGQDLIITVPVGTVVKETSRHDPAAEEDLLVRVAAKEAAKSRAEGAEAAPAQGARDAPPQPEDPMRHHWLVYPGMSSSDVMNIEFPRLPTRRRLFSQPPTATHLDLSRPNPRPILLAAGGIGGLGNPNFVTIKTPRPLYATKGEQPISLTLELELKLLADVGLVGLPNAGKSTLLRALSNSRARVGSWAFTTLQPNIGTVVLDNNKGRPLLNSIRRQKTPGPYDWAAADDTEVAQRTRFTVADIPGLIEGAHLDKGLGIAFLRHVERAGVLAFVIDLSAGNAVKALKALWNEVGLYAHMREEEERDRERDSRISWSADSDTDPADRFNQVIFAEYPPPPESVSGLHIAGKPWFVVATKGDLPDTQENFEELRSYLTSITNGDTPHPSGIERAWTKDCAAIPISAINGHGVERIVHWTVGLLDS